MKGESKKRKKRKQKVVECEQEREEREGEAGSEDRDFEQKRNKREGKAESEDRDFEQERDEREGKAVSEDGDFELERDELERKADSEDRDFEQEREEHEEKADSEDREGEKESEIEDTECQELLRIKNVEFDKLYKGPKHYFPGDRFSYQFDDCQVDERRKHALKKELFLRKEKITRSLKKLFQKDHITMKRSLLLYPCYFRECRFQGHNLSRHLQSKEHQISSKVAKLQQSFFTRQVNYLTKVSKTKQNQPVMCSKCHLFFDRIDLHLYNNHQLRRKSKELESQIIKSKTLTNHFLEDFDRKKELDSKDIKKKSKESANHDNIDNVDKHNPRHKMFRKSKRNQIRKPKESHKQRKEQLVKKKIKVKK